MQSGNGIDLAAIYRLLTEVAEKVAAQDRRFDQFDRRFEEIDQRFDEVAAVLNDHTRKIDNLTAGVADLRSTVNDYHATVMGHGIHLTNLSERVRRLEEHAGFDPLPASTL